jgi:inhibitor of KinA
MNSNYDSASAGHLEPVFRFAGEGGVIVEFGEHLNLQVNNAALAFDQAIHDDLLSGIIETTPTIRSVFVRFDPLIVHSRDVATHLRGVLSDIDWLKQAPGGQRTLWRVPAIYGGNYGPDLDRVAEFSGRSPEETIASHVCQRQRVLMIGFAPGQAYLGILDETWNIPRLEKITPRVETGSIAVAIRQTVLFPDASPTGWSCIGRSPFRSFRQGSDQPFPLKAGDELQFVEVSETEFTQLLERDRKGELIVQGSPI